jgi:4,5-DOPA dioxygenase extradiol
LWLLDGAAAHARRCAVAPVWRHDGGMSDASPLSHPAPATGVLQPSSRMPVLFVGHGSPMNAIEDNEYRRSWQALGAEFTASWPRPQVILCISAHWLTQGWWLTAMERPKTIHDFGGFPQELFAQQYPAPGWPAAAQEMAAVVGEPAIGLDTAQWGLDHGAWSVLKPMFPAADIPVIQLGMDYSRPPAEHFALGRKLRPLRERGVLIVGTGNIVHNLRTMQRDAPPDRSYEWAMQFDSAIAGEIRRGDLRSLADFQQLGEPAALSQPSHEHFLPLLYCAGAVEAGEPVRFFNERWQGLSISMRSVIWG